MTKRTGEIEKMHMSEGQKKINKLRDRINTTKYNIEVSEEIIASTPYDAQREKLIEKNIQRRHAIGSLEKEIRDMHQMMCERGREETT